MDVSIIIVNYNTESLILDCIDSIYKQTRNLDFEIIVVDNASPEGVKYLHKDNRIRLIQAQSNLGFGRANNLGAQYAVGRYLFLLNPDTILVNNAIFILLDFMEKNKYAGVCGGNLYTKDMLPCHSYKVIAPGLLYELNDLLRGIPSKILGSDHFNNTGKCKDVAYITGADLFIRKEIFEQVGGFDKDFFMYFEETYLCYKVRKQGKKVVNVPQAKIIHLEGQSFKLKEERELLFYEGRHQYLTKCYSPRFIKVCNVIAKMNCLVNIVYFTLRKKEELNLIWRYRLKQLNKKRKYPQYSDN